MNAKERYCQKLNDRNRIGANASTPLNKIPNTDPQFTRIDAAANLSELIFYASDLLFRPKPDLLGNPRPTDQRRAAPRFQPKLRECRKELCRQTELIERNGIGGTTLSSPLLHSTESQAQIPETERNNQAKQKQKHRRVERKKGWYGMVWYRTARDPCFSNHRA